MSISWISRIRLTWLGPMAAALLLTPVLGSAQVNVEVSANVAPPELPVYDQPPIPGDGFVWTPGYWAWSDDYQDYYWVPGTWIQAPQPDYLWTPGYWGVAGAVFLWHAGYWGPHVGFYGGVNYGYGYGGNGYDGGYWQGGHMYYNRSVNNISNVNITNVYNKTVINNVTVNRVSYNGGNGVHAQATPAQMAVANEHHIPATQAQQQHVRLASGQENLRASQNHGHPPIAATSRPAAFNGAGVVGSKQGGTMSVVHANPPTPPHAPAPTHAPAPPHPAAAPGAGAPEVRQPPPHPQGEPRPAPPVHTEAQPRPAPPPAPHPQPQQPHPPEHDSHEHR